MKDVRAKILKGDFSTLLGLDSDKNFVHPNDVAILIGSLPLEVATQSLISLPKASQAKVFAYLNFDWQLQIIKGISKEKASVILNNLPSDDRFEFFSKLVGIEQSHFLEYLSEKNRAETHDFFGYPTNSIARLINTEFSTIARHMTVGEAIDHLREHPNDTEAANVIYVIDEEGKLVDDIPIRKLVLNESYKSIESILDGFCVSLNIEDTKEIAIDKFKEYDRDVLPVVGDKNVLIGVLTADDVLDFAEQRDTEDIQKFGGLESLDFPYVKTPILTLIKKRAGWLIVLFLSEMLTASAMGYFDDEISKAVVLALFIPLIISSGGNSGSQAATLIIRAMALKEISFSDWWFVMKREFSSGIVLGIILGAIGFIRIVIWQHLHWFNYSEHYLLVATTIFFSLIGIVMWGTLSGSMIPIALKKLGFDPATSSAPFVATLVDVTGLIIYFSIAAFLLKGTLL
ncbi:MULTISPECIES: magnesium transporter [unclassified Arcicella]|uniref:magnesium transporter n=1 Tax=unclassified Arcicella TaxID=2644986 RepID=UPI002859EB21|nr:MULTISPECIES: magnesium transporter [unclassified Arcicella]MDR6564078.1 magnesium transporter [Arcicella sp. BE51]MDR6813831.1 magnesium transporter [Arcicella sp. BE140]MDR6825143.1 magnesium transporter [Arcicella sp. BE139]